MPPAMPETAELIRLGLLLVALGGVAGVIAGLLGVGGGIILVPAFYYAFTSLGYNGPEVMQVCLATSLATILVTSSRSIHSHSRKGAVDWDILRTMGAGIGVGAVLGTLLVSQLRSTTLMVVFGVLALLVGGWLGLGNPHWRLAQSMPRGWRRRVLSVVIGFLSVLMGIGGGSFGVPVMTLYGAPIHRAVATASGFGFLIAVPSVILFLLLPVEPGSRPPLTLGTINLGAFALVIAMTLVTTPWGVRLAHRMNPGLLRRVFALFLVLLAANMLRKAAGY